MGLTAFHRNKKKKACNKNSQRALDLGGFKNNMLQK
jgi:hypothetical protein